MSSLLKDNTTTIQEILNAVNTLPFYVDTSDANATANNIESGYTAYVNSIKISGQLSRISNLILSGVIISGDNQNSTTTYKLRNPRILDEETTIQVIFPLNDENFGSATKDQVLQGKSFSSSAGIRIQGTMPLKAASDVTINGATVTIPYGYYDSQVQKSVSTITQATPTISINASGLITASATQTAGYVSAGTKEATATIPTETKTITENGTYTPSSGKYFSSVTVNTPVGYKSGDIVKATSISLSLGTSYMSVSVTYGTSIVNTNGTLSLGDSTTVNASSASDLDVVKGKYVRVSSTIYYIPTDASITHTGSSYNKSYTSDKANPVFVIA